MKGKMQLYEKVLVYGILVASILLFVFASRGAFAYTGPANVTSASLSDMRVDPAQAVTWTLGPVWNATGLPVGGGNSSLSFNGLNQSVNVPYSATLSCSTGLGLEARIKLSALDSYQIVAMKRNYLYRIVVDGDNKLRGGVMVGGNYYTSISTETLSLNTRTHIAVTYDASAGNIKLYINGAETSYDQQDVVTGNIETDTNSFDIATEVAAASWFSGVIDEFRTYNRAPSPTEVAQHYQGIYLNDTGLVLYLPFDGDTLDYSGEGNDGTPVNGPTYTDGWASVPISTYYNGTISSTGRVLVNSTTGDALGFREDAPTPIGTYNGTIVPDNSIGNGTITGFIVDRYEVYLEAQYEETEAGLQTLLTAQGESAVDGHSLGAGDTFTINGVAFTYNTYTGNFTGTVSKSTPQTVTYGTAITGAEATYTITNFSVNNTAVVTWTTSTLSRLQTGFGTGDWVGTIINEYVATAGGLATYTFIIGMISIAVYNISGVYATLFIWVLGWGTWSAVVHGEAQWLGIAFLCLGLGLAIVKMFMDRRTT